MLATGAALAVASSFLRGSLLSFHDGFLNSRSAIELLLLFYTNAGGDQGVRKGNSYLLRARLLWAAVGSISICAFIHNLLGFAADLE